MSLPRSKNLNSKGESGGAVGKKRNFESLWWEFVLANSSNNSSNNYFNDCRKLLNPRVRWGVRERIIERTRVGRVFRTHFWRMGRLLCIVMQHTPSPCYEIAIASNANGELCPLFNHCRRRGFSLAKILIKIRGNCITLTLRKPAGML